MSNGTVIPFSTADAAPKPESAFTVAQRSTERLLTFFGAVRMMLRMLNERLTENKAGSTFVYEGDMSINISPAAKGDARALALEVARVFNVTEPVEKQLDEYSGKIRYIVPVSLESLNAKNDYVESIRVIVSGGEARCKIRALTTEEWVPPSAGYSRKTTKYVIENPEECGAARKEV